MRVDFKKVKRFLDGFYKLHTNITRFNLHSHHHGIRMSLGDDIS